MFVLAWQGFDGLINFQSLPGCLAAANCFHMFHRGTETEARHVSVQAFELIRVYGICFVPDTNSCHPRQ